MVEREAPSGGNYRGGLRNTCHKMNMPSAKPRYSSEILIPEVDMILQIKLFIIEGKQREAHSCFNKKDPEYVHRTL